MAAWIDHLDEEDQQFVRRFLLHSGSLKGLAKEYGVSYPTVRLRLDRLIAKIRVLDELAQCSPVERRLRLLLAEGAITPEVYDQLLAAHREESHEASPAMPSPATALPATDGDKSV